MTLAAARDDQFLVEQDLHEAAAPMDGLLRNRDHHAPEPSVAVSHRVTVFVPEPGICPVSVIRYCPQTARPITDCGYAGGPSIALDPPVCAAVRRSAFIG